MKKRIFKVLIISVFIVGILVSVLSIMIKKLDFAKQDAEASIVRVGQYSITKAELETYYPITQLKNTDNIDLKAAALECAKEKLMEEEIKGTEYEITHTSKEDRLNQVVEKGFTEKELEYLEKNDVSKDELIEIVAAQDWHYLVYTRHFTMFCQTYMQSLDEEEKKAVVSDEIIAAHEEYLNNKIDEMDYNVVDEKNLQSLDLIVLKDLEQAIDSTAS